MNLGIGIKKVLSQRGETQKSIAQKLSISEVSISQIVNGSKQPRKDTLERIASALDVYPELFYLLSAEVDEVPEEKRKVFEMYWPSFEKIVISTYDKKVE